MSKMEQVYEAIFQKVDARKMYLSDVKFKDKDEFNVFMVSSDIYFSKKNRLLALWNREIKHFCHSQLDIYWDNYCNEYDGLDDEFDDDGELISTGRPDCPIYDSFVTLKRRHRISHETYDYDDETLCGRCTDCRDSDYDLCAPCFQPRRSNPCGLIKLEQLSEKEIKFIYDYMMYHIFDPKLAEENFDAKSLRKKIKFPEL